MLLKSNYSMRREHFLICRSTQIIARSRPDVGILITSDFQTRGEGTFAKTWISHMGNMFGTYVFPGIDRAFSQYLYIAVAIAITDFLLEIGITAKIKMPNDIMVDGAKLAGTLIENYGDRVLIGIGINVREKAHTTQPTTCIHDTLNIRFDTDALWGMLSGHICSAIGMLSIGDVDAILDKINKELLL